jgi:hypothetical protein
MRAGVAGHLWISARVGLGMVADGFAAHLAMVVVGHRRLARNGHRVMPEQ